MGQKISVKIGERSFSLTAASEQQEQAIRMAADIVTQRYDNYVRQWPGKSPAELMAMVALNESIARVTVQMEGRRTQEEVSKLNKDLEQYLSQH